MLISFYNKTSQYVFANSTLADLLHLQYRHAQVARHVDLVVI